MIFYHYICLTWEYNLMRYRTEQDWVLMIDGTFATNNFKQLFLIV